MQKWAAAAIVVAALLTGTIWITSPQTGNSQPPGLLRAENPQIVAQGETVYVESCASCHGDNLEGEANWQTRDAEGYLPAPPHDETGHTWHHKDQLLFDITKFGIQKFAGADYKTKMPAYQDDLSDEDIIAVLSYIKAQWPEQIRSRHDQLNETTE